MRWRTREQNGFNRQLNKNNKSGIKGVGWHKRDQKWYVQITFCNKQIHLGYFVKLEDAKNARQAKAKELFGNFINVCEL